MVARRGQIAEADRLARPGWHQDTYVNCRGAPSKPRSCDSVEGVLWKPAVWILWARTVSGIYCRMFVIGCKLLLSAKRIVS